MADPLSYFGFSQCSMTGVVKTGMCYPVCVGGAYKRTLAANRKE